MMSPEATEALSAMTEDLRAELSSISTSHDRLLGACRLIAGKDYDEPAGRIAVLAAEEAIKQAPPKIAEKKFLTTRQPWGILRVRRKQC